jgi:diadenosine tetraphosphate (Ap4A) HIT family hydrolase
MYNSENVFFKIINGEIPSEFVFENKHCIAINDIEPKAKAHVLVLPKGQYESLNDFLTDASDEEKLAVFDAIKQVAESLGLDKNGYRVVANVGKFGGQVVPHLHFHVLGGECLKDVGL